MKLVLPIIILLILSTLSLLSVGWTLALNQLGLIGLGVVIFFIFSKIPYDTHRLLVKIYAGVSLVLLLLPFLFGELTRGAVRWISLGLFTLQPSELVKPLLIIIFSSLLAVKARLGPYLLALVIPAALIFKQPDLGSTLLVSAIWLGMLFVSRIKILTLIILLAVLAIASPVGWHQLKPYQQARWRSFINPYTDPQASGYHLIQSVISIGSGGLFGRGFGRGTQAQLQFLPERHTDFIFASWAEETGLAGSIILLLVYFWLLNSILGISRLAPDELGRLIGMGVFCLIFFQGFVNLGMNLGLVPVTGITLPLVSSGGSSLLGIAACLGLVENIRCLSQNQRPLAIR